MDVQNVSHLFICTAHPTTLTPENLWTGQDDTRTELSRPGEPELTMRMVEFDIQQKQTCAIYIHRLSLSIYPQEAITKYCAHLHHPLAALTRYFPNPRLTHRTLVQLRTTHLPSSNHTYTKWMPNHIHHHYAPSETHTHHTPSLQLHLYTHHIVTPGFVDIPRWSDGAAGQIEI